MKEELFKPSATIHIPRKLSLFEQQIWNILLSKVFGELENREVHQVYIEELYAYWPYERHDSTKFKQALRNLVDTSLEYNFMGRKGSVWGVFSLLSEANIEKGICTFAYPPTLRKRLNNPEVYAKISLAIQQRFTSKHSLAIYELCTDYKYSPEKCTPWMTLPEARKFLGLDGNQYNEWMDFKKRLILLPIKEVNEKSDLTLAYEVRKNSRKIDSIRFSIQVKDKSQILERDLNTQNKLLVSRGKLLKISRVIMTEMIKKHSSENIEKAFKVVEATPHVKNPTGLFCKAIEENWSC